MRYSIFSLLRQTLSKHRYDVIVVGGGRHWLATNYNSMVSQRVVLNLYHPDAQRDAYARSGNAMRMYETAAAPNPTCTQPISMRQHENSMSFLR